MAWVMLLSGCASSERDTLSLSGFKSVTVVVKVQENLPYASDKLTELAQRGIDDVIASNLTWSKTAKPRAELTLEITDIYEPSEAAQLTIGIPYQIKYTLTGRDAETKAPLGVVYGLSKARVRASILVEGSQAAFFDKNFERGWSDGTRQSPIVGQLVVNFERDINHARKRQPSLAPTPQPQSPQDKLVVNKGRLVALNGN
ncbi:MAG: hypothetical protein AAB364_02565 [Patescibacteria group bacterium]